MVICFDRIHERDRQTDTARRNRSRLCKLLRGKNYGKNSLALFLLTLFLEYCYTIARYLPPTKELYVFARTLVFVCVCLSVCKITQKPVHGFG